MFGKRKEDHGTFEEISMVEFYTSRYRVLEAGWLADVCRIRQWEWEGDEGSNDRILSEGITPGTLPLHREEVLQGVLITDESSLFRERSERAL